MPVGCCRRLVIDCLNSFMSVTNLSSLSRDKIKHTWPYLESSGLLWINSVCDNPTQLVYSVVHSAVRTWCHHYASWWATTLGLPLLHIPIHQVLFWDTQWLGDFPNYWLSLATLKPAMYLWWWLNITQMCQTRTMNMADTTVADKVDCTVLYIVYKLCTYYHLFIIIVLGSVNHYIAAEIT